MDNCTLRHWRWFAHSVAVTIVMTSPGQAQEARSLWNHNGSTMSLVASGATRQFYYEEPRPGMQQAGAQKGSLLFTGQYAGGRYAGTAFIYDERCGRIPYQVSGPVLDNFETVVLSGKAPRMGGDCAIRGTFTDTLQFTLMKPGERPSSAGLLPRDFTGLWIEAGKANNACRADEWDKRGSGDRDFEFMNRLIKVSESELNGWELQCRPIAVRRAQSWSADQPAVETEMNCTAESLSWNATELWNVRTIDNRRHLLITTLKTTNMRDFEGRRMDNAKSAINAEYLECR